MDKNKSTNNIRAHMDTFHKYDGLCWAIEQHSKLKEYERTTQSAPTR